MLEVEDAEDPLTLLLLQQVVDEEQGVGVVLGLRVQIAVVHGQPPLPPTSFERTRTWEADLFEHSLERAASSGSDAGLGTGARRP